jgi:hypothetical protein
MMQIRLGYELVYDCPQPTPMLLMLNVHYTRIRHRGAGSPRDQPLHPDPCLSRRLWQLVQSDCGAGRTNPAVRQRDREIPANPMW